MDWNKQTQDMFKSWSETQKKMWDTFSASMSDYQGVPDQKFWEQTLATGQKAVENTFTAQSDWSKKWVEYLEGIEDLPPQVLESAKQSKEMFNRWGETQEQLWNSWFDMLKDFDMSGMGKDWAEKAQDPLRMWQENSQKIMETQSNWIKSWMNAYSGEEPEKE